MSAAHVIASIVRWTGLAWLVRTLYARRRVSIVLYHDPRPETLDAQLSYLRRRYTPIPLADLVAALRSGDWRSLPPRPLAITIDDGHAANAALGPVFARHGITPTLFVCTQIVDTTRHFWFLDTPAGEVERLKALGNRERLEELARLTGFEEDREYGEGSRQALDAGELATLGDGFDLASHGRFHPVLTKCDDETAEREIRDSRAEAAPLAGGECAHFAYPLGAYREREVATVEAAGYESARTVDIGWNGPRSDPYRLKILSVADDLSETMLTAELSGLKWLVRLLRGEGRLDGTFRPQWDTGIAR